MSFFSHSSTKGLISAAMNFCKDAAGFVVVGGEEHCLIFLVIPGRREASNPAILDIVLTHL